MHLGSKSNSISSFHECSDLLSNCFKSTTTFSKAHSWCKRFIPGSLTESDFEM